MKDSEKPFYIRYPHSGETWNYAKEDWLLWLWDMKRDFHRFVGGSSNPVAGHDDVDFFELTNTGWILLSSTDEATEALNELNDFTPPQYKLERWGEGLSTVSGSLEELILLIQEQKNSSDLRIRRSRWLLSDQFSKACIRFDPFMRQIPYDPLVTAEGKKLLNRFFDLASEPN